MSNENLNEIKIRISDRLYDAIKIQRCLGGFPSDSSTIRHMLEISAFGIVGMLPEQIGAVSDEIARIGTRALA